MSFIIRLVRWNIWYDSKIPFFLMCMFYAALNNPVININLINDMAVLLIMLCLYASLGHVINSYCDRSDDLLAGKENALLQISERKAKILVWSVVIITISITLFVYFDQPAVFLLFFLAVIIAVFYSMPPLRFKERGILGLIAASIAQRTLPVVIVFQAMDAWNWTSVLICLLSTFTGVRYIIVHQIRDKNADLFADVKTVATRKGTLYLQKLLKHIIFPLELLAFAIVIFLMSLEYQEIALLSVIYIFWSVLQLIILDKSKETRFSIDSYTIFADYYYVYWPLVLCARLIEYDAYFWIVFIFALVWLLRRLIREITHGWIVINTLIKKLSLST